MKTLLILIVCMAAQSQANAQPDIEDRNQRGSSVEVTSHPEEKAISRNLIRAGATCNVNSYGRILHIGSPMISVPIEFQKLIRLKQLDLSGTLISDGDLERLQTLSTLRHLSLNDSFVTEVGVARLQQVLIECVIESDC